MSQGRYIDPITHAWRHCNPQVPLPSGLVPRAALSGLELNLYSSHGHPVAEWSGTTKDTQNGLLTVALLPRISP